MLQVANTISHTLKAYGHNKNIAACGLRLAVFLCLLVTSSSCATSTVRPILDGVDTTGNKIYFSDNAESILIALNNYAAVYEISTPESQIDYLLMRLQTTHYTLERNYAIHSPSEANQFLRWKMGRPKHAGTVKTVRDFVNVICAGSISSGKPYVATLPDGSRHNLQTIFSNELDLLEDFLDN